MLDSKGFDLWSDEYDNTVDRNSKCYPFDGYYKGLTYIYDKIIEDNKSKKILDIGFGTGTLTEKLYNRGFQIYGIDFSENMIEIASKKMPNAKLIKHDFNNGLPKEIIEEKFDYIISSYAFHHLTNEKKVQFIKLLYNHLKIGGTIIVLDIAFETEDDFNRCHKENKEDWDDSEIYIIWDNLKKLIDLHCKYNQISSCAGIIEIVRGKI